MYFITTRNFPPENGGMQILMGELANALSKHGFLKVFAEKTNGDEEYDKQVNYEISRISGLKFLRKYRKANLIKDYLKNNQNIKVIIADHWKSLENINSEILKGKKTLCLIHSKEINHPVGTILNRRMIKSFQKADFIIANSNFTKKLAVNLNLDEEKIIVINPGIEKKINSFNRQALHAKSLGFIHPGTKKEVFFEEINKFIPGNILVHIEYGFCKFLGIKKLNISDELDPVLSMALGAGETTLERLTTAYAMLVNGGRKISPSLIDRVQNRKGLTIAKHDDRLCLHCKQEEPDFSLEIKIVDSREQIIDPVHAYQVVSMLEGAVLRGTGKKVSAIKKPIAGKTGTTNNNTDTWFIGFTSKLVVGIYVGFDEPASLGRYETGGKTAMPIFKKFILNSISKQDATPFKVPDGIVMMVVDPATGQKVDFNSKNSIYESFKGEKMSEVNIENNYNDLIFNNSKVGTKEIIRFY